MGIPDGLIRIDNARNGTAVGVAMRPVGGFRWYSGRAAQIDDPEGDLDPTGGPDEPWLVGSASGWTPIPVLRRADLADQFEAVGRNPTPQRVLAFANRYGWLHGPAPFWGTFPGAPADAHRLMQGESHREWSVEARAFRDLRTIWRASRDLRLSRAEPGLAEASPSDAEPEMSEDKANEALVTAIDLSEEMVVRRRNGGTAVRVVDPEVWSEISDAPEAAGMFVVCHEINERLEGRVSPVLLPFHGADQVLVPDTLLAAIYWRFSAEVSADSRNPIRRRCDNPECEGWVVGRPNKKHCSDYCGSRLRDLRRMGQAPKHV